MFYAANGGGSALPQILLIVLFFALFYFLLMRPMRRRQQAAAAAQDKMRSELTAGDEVVTIGGLMATVVSADDESVTLEISPGVNARYDLKAIARIVPPPDSEDSLEAVEPEPTANNSVIEERD